MTEEFTTALKEANKAYSDGNHKEALELATDAERIALEMTIQATRKKSWSARQVGYKENDESIRVKMYCIARTGAQFILDYSRDFEMRNSAIKLLMLLPGSDIESLCKIGVREVKFAELINEGEKESWIGELRNSLGIEVRKTDPRQAMDIFLSTHETVKSKTVIAGHLMQNAGTCLLMQMNETKYINMKHYYAHKAIQLLQKAIDEYPEDQKGHRESVKNKINNTKEEIKNNFQ
ncbi:MAG: hypothetical protein KAI67_03385 [Candidatus Pacebacteria bacterium]|nr:hypothetical protein [Candidatus Paceibacterota bacterium]